MATALKPHLEVRKCNVNNVLLKLSVTVIKPIITVHDNKTTIVVIYHTIHFLKGLITVTCTCSTCYHCKKEVAKSYKHNKNPVIFFPKTIFIPARSI